MRGIVKIIKAKSGITASPVVSGIVKEAGTTNTYSFDQVDGTELGIQVGTKVSFEVAEDTTGTNVAYSLRSLEKGIIQTANPPDSNNVISGTLIEVSTSDVLPFAQVNFPVDQIVTGIKVGYETIIDPATGETTAVCLIVAPNS